MIYLFARYFFWIQTKNLNGAGGGARLVDDGDDDDDDDDDNDDNCDGDY